MMTTTIMTKMWPKGSRSELRYKVPAKALWQLLISHSWISSSFQCWR